MLQKTHDRRLISRAYWLAGLFCALWLVIGVTAFGTWSFLKAPRSVVHALAYVQASDYRTDADDLAVPKRPLPLFLARKVTIEATGERSMSEWMALLRRQGVRICFEDCRGSHGTPDHEFAMGLNDVPVHEALETFVFFDPHYRWECWEEAGIVNVVPKNSRLDARAGDVSFRGRALVACLQEPALCNGAKVFQPFLMGARHPTDKSFWLFDMDVRGASARDYLNLMAAQYEGMTWDINQIGAVGFHQPDDAAAAVRDAIWAKPRATSQ